MLFGIGIIVVSCVFTNAAYQLKLANVTGYAYEGTVLIKVNETWGRVMTSGFDETTVNTFCKLLGFGYVGFIVNRFNDNEGLPYVVSEIKCFGNETNINECSVTPLPSIIGGNYAPGIHCFAHEYTDIRLVGGVTASEGVVEVKMDGRWGRVCRSTVQGFIPNVYRPLCRTFGYSTYNFTVEGQLSNYNYPNGGISWVDLQYTQCEGSETDFRQCKFEHAIYYQPGCQSQLVIKCAETTACLSVGDCLGSNVQCNKNTEQCTCDSGYIFQSNYCVKEVDTTTRDPGGDGTSNSLTYIIAGIGAGLVIIVIVILVVCYIQYHRRRKNKPSRTRGTKEKIEIPDHDKQNDDDGYHSIDNLTRHDSYMVLAERNPKDVPYSHLGGQLKGAQEVNGIKQTEPGTKQGPYGYEGLGGKEPHGYSQLGHSSSKQISENEKPLPDYLDLSSPSVREVSRTEIEGYTYPDGYQKPRKLQ